jgi:hypothetical protein
LAIAVSIRLVAPSVWMVFAWANTRAAIHAAGQVNNSAKV